jgi:hypothetical protein
MFERDINGKPIIQLNPLASNHLPDGRTMFTKVHGVKSEYIAGQTKTLEFTIPYTSCFLTGAEIVFDVKSTANMEVAHPQAGTLEQYGYDVNEGAVQYIRESKYGAELVAGLVLKCEVTNTTANTIDIGVNFLLIDVRTPAP